MAIHALTGPGTYSLVIALGHAQTLRIGRRGRFRFPAGFYIYVGSALGPGGLRGRLARHLGADKRLHWHIDYLLASRAAHVVQVWIVRGPARQECEWARAIWQLPRAEIAVPGFGASDCQCRAHLIRFDLPPDVKLAATSRGFAAERIG